MASVSDTLIINSLPSETFIKGDKIFFPDKIELFQNYPNPFNPSTTIKIGLPRTDYIILQVFDTLGQLVTTLFEGKLSAGYHRFVFRNNHLPSGIYYYRLKTSNALKIKKLVLLR